MISLPKSRWCVKRFRVMTSPWEHRGMVLFTMISRCCVGLTNLSNETLKPGSLVPEIVYRESQTSHGTLINPGIQVVTWSYKQSTPHLGGFWHWQVRYYHSGEHYPDSKVHGAIMGPIWGRQDPGGPHVGPMNFAIWVVFSRLSFRQFGAAYRTEILTSVHMMMVQLDDVVVWYPFFHACCDILRPSATVTMLPIPLWPYYAIYWDLFFSQLFWACSKRS